MTQQQQPAASANNPSPANENSLAFAIPAAGPSSAPAAKNPSGPAGIAAAQVKPKATDRNSDNTKGQAGSDAEEGIDPLSEIVAVTAGESASAAVASSGLVGGIGGVTAAAPIGLAAAGAAAVGLAGAGGDDAPAGGGAGGGGANGPSATSGNQNTSTSGVGANPGSTGSGSNTSAGTNNGANNNTNNNTNNTNNNTNNTNNTNGNDNNTQVAPSTLSDHVDTVLNIEDPAGGGFTLNTALSPVLDRDAPAGPAAGTSLRDVLDTVITAEVPGVGPIDGTPLEGASLDTLPQAQIPQQAPVVGGSSLNTVLDPLLDTLSGQDAGSGSGEPSEPPKPPSAGEAVRTAAVPVTLAASTGDALIAAAQTDIKAAPDSATQEGTALVDAAIKSNPDNNAAPLTTALQSQPLAGAVSDGLTGMDPAPVKDALSSTAGGTATGAVLAEAGKDLQTAIVGEKEQPPGGGTTPPPPPPSEPAPSGVFSEGLATLESMSLVPAPDSFTGGAARLDKETAPLQEELPAPEQGGGGESQAPSEADVAAGMEALVATITAGSDDTGGGGTDEQPGLETITDQFGSVGGDGGGGGTGDQPGLETITDQFGGGSGDTGESPSLDTITGQFGGGDGSGDTGESPSLDTITGQFGGGGDGESGSDPQQPALSTSLGQNTETVFDAAIDGADQFDRGVASIPTSQEQGEDFLTGGPSSISSTSGAGPLPDSLPPG